MQEIQSILTNTYSSFSHFAIDQQILHRWHDTLSTPIETTSLLLDCLPQQVGLERNLDTLLLSHILPQNLLSDEVIPASFQYAKNLSQKILHGVNITDLSIIEQLDNDDISAIFNLYSAPDQLRNIQQAFNEYRSFKEHFGSLLNLLKQAHYKLIDVIGSLVQIIPSFQERVPLADMDIPFHSNAFGLLIPMIQLLQRDGNIIPDRTDIPLYTDRIIIQVLYSSGLFGTKETTIQLAHNSTEYAELMACSILALDKLSHSLHKTPLEIQFNLHAIHSNMLRDSALSLTNIKIEIHR